MSSTARVKKCNRLMRICIFQLPRAYQRPIKSLSGIYRASPKTRIMKLGEEEEMDSMYM